jgi:hypothetical protein
MAHPAEEAPRVHLDLETTVRLVSTGRMGKGVPDMAEVQFGCPDCQHLETVMVDVVPTFAMMALHRGRSHQPADAARRQAAGLVDVAGQPLNRRRRRNGTA